MSKKTLILVIAVILVVVAVGIYVLFMRSSTQAPTSGPGQLPPPTLVEVPFEYTVKEVAGENIILNGEQGDLTLPKNPAMVTVYQGDRGSTQTVDFTALTTGQQVNVDLVPGRSASIYILE